MLLRQTSFRALAERAPSATPTARSPRAPCGSGSARSRPAASRSPPAGRARFDELVAEVDRRLADDPDAVARRRRAARSGARACRPPSEACGARASAASRYRVDDGVAAGRTTPEQRAALATAGHVRPRLVGAGRAAPGADRLRGLPAAFRRRHLRLEPHRRRLRTGGDDAEQGGAVRDLGWMSDVVGREVAVPEEVYAAESAASLHAAARRAPLTRDGTPPAGSSQRARRAMVRAAPAV